MNHIQEIPIGEIQVEPNYNVRLAGDLHLNAKEVAANMEAQHDDAREFVIKYVEKDGVKYTRNHATLEAAKTRGWKTILARKAAFDHGSKEDIADLYFSNNGGHHLSRNEQGAVFVRLRDGELADQTQEIAEAPVGTEITERYLREPLTIKQISELMKPRLSEQHIRDCITLHESPEAIATLQESNKITGAAILEIKKFAKGDEAKWFKVCKAAIAYANENDKLPATKKHFDAVKADFVELKAAEVPQEPKSKGKGKSAEPATEDADEAPETQEAPPELFAAPVPSCIAVDSKTTGDIRDQLIALFLNTDNTEGVTLDQDTAEALADKAIEIFTATPEVF